MVMRKGEYDIGYNAVYRKNTVFKSQKEKEEEEGSKPVVKNRIRV